MFVRNVCKNKKNLIFLPTPRPTIILKATKSQNTLGNADTKLKRAITNPEMKTVGFRPNLSVKGPMIMAPTKKPKNTAANAKVA